MKSRMRSLTSHGLLDADFPDVSVVLEDTEYDGGDLVGAMVAEGGTGVNVEIRVTEGVIQ